MGYIGASVDSAIGFSDSGLLTGMGADIVKRYQAILLIGLQKILIQILIESGILVILPVPLIFNAKAVMPSCGFRFNNSTHPYKGLFIKDAAPLRDVGNNMLEPSPEDSNAKVVTE